VAIAWGVVLLALACVRLRGHWPAYTALHQWLHDHGVPSAVRNLDAALLQLAWLAVGLWWIRRRTGRSCRELLWLGRGGTPHQGLGPGATVLLAALPMVVGGLWLGVHRGGPPPTIDWAALADHTLRAPLLEELLYRGLLVGVALRCLGPRHGLTRASTWTAALLFGSLHVPWSLSGILDHWPTLLVTTIGGLWFAWLLRRWQSLWVPFGLHAAMNLGWQLMGSSGGAGGGGWTDNLLRAATIAIACWGTARGTTRSEFAATPVRPLR
jgi:membrane protease YdiL (CAAX protease family)